MQSFFYFTVIFIKTAHNGFMQKTFRCAISYIFKCLTVIFSLGGVLLSFLTAKEEGYFPWYTRLFYFTAQSNIWIGLTFLTILIVNFFFPRARRFKDKLYFLKFVFGLLQNKLLQLLFELDMKHH